MNIEQRKYPIGQFNLPNEVKDYNIQTGILIIQEFPDKLKQTLDGQDFVDFNWQYRPKGWNISQLIHHCADSHINSFIRFKLALTEENPQVKPYFEDKWADTPEVNNEHVQDSINIIQGIHARWTSLLKSMTTEDFERSFYHPEMDKNVHLWANLALYDWHCNHHHEHLKIALNSKGNF